MPILPLDVPYPSRQGAPILTHVDTAIFTQTYFAHCMACTFCHDACCLHGVDVELPTVARILSHAEALEPLVGQPKDRWFSESIERDAEFPGGAARRTSVIDGQCVFRNRAGRGCTLHAYSLGAGLDYHELKPLVSVLFPLTFYDGVLCLADELDADDELLICAGSGLTVYRALRAEVEWYFGTACVRALDAFDDRREKRTDESPRRLPVVA